MVTIWLLGLALAGGWRGDGTSRYPDAPGPEAWRKVWTAPMPAKSNATPVLMGDMVCTTAEPAHLACVDAATGAPRWSHDFPVVGALSGEERARAETALTTAQADEAALIEARQEYSRLRRTLRSGGGPDTATALEALSRRIDELATRVQAAAPYHTGEDRDLIGYASATPTTDGQTLYAVLGNGVLVAVARDGTVRWQRWLGPAPRPMRGYDLGATSCPQLVGGVLVVPYAKLRGVDPASGRDRWVEDAPWLDYGTPAVGVIDGHPLILTPDGRAVEATTGRELAKGLGDVWFIGPTLVGDTLYSIGGPSEGMILTRGAVDAGSWTLDFEGDRLVARERWKREIPAGHAFYTAPMILGDTMVVVDREGTLIVLDARDGRERSRGPITQSPGGAIFPNPFLMGTRLWVLSELGEWYGFDLTGDAPRLVARQTTTATRSTPVPSGRGLFLRDVDGLHRLE